MRKHHCFISASLVSGVRRWTWHAETADGITLHCCGVQFGNFDECVRHAVAQGYAHIEVPVLTFVAPTDAHEVSVDIKRRFLGKLRVAPRHAPFDTRSYFGEALGSAAAPDAS